MKGGGNFSQAVADSHLALLINFSLLYLWLVILQHVVQIRNELASDCFSFLKKMDEDSTHMKW